MEYTFDPDLAIEDYRGRNKVRDWGWWILFPDWMRDDAEKLKASWFGLGGHPAGALRGFEFLGGPRYTYDQGNDTWAQE